MIRQYPILFQMFPVSACESLMFVPEADLLTTAVAKGSNSGKFEIAVCWNNSWGKWGFASFAKTNCTIGSDGNIEVPCVNNNDVTVTIDDGAKTLTAVVQ